MRYRLKTRPAGERGAVLVEAALVVPLLMVIAASLIELGVAWRVDNQMSRSIREATVTLARGGSERQTDFLVLDEIRDSISTNDAVRWVMVYRAASGDGSPPAACLTRAQSMTGPSDGVADTCNIYRGDYVPLASATDFSDPHCSGDPDEWLCPTARGAVFGEGDRIGVMIDFHHRWLFGYLPGTGLDLSDHAVSPLLRSIKDPE